VTGRAVVVGMCGVVLAPWLSVACGYQHSERGCVRVCLRRARLAASVTLHRACPRPRMSTPSAVWHRCSCMSAVMYRLGMTQTSSAHTPEPSRLSSAMRRLRVRWYSRSRYLAAVGCVLSQGMVIGQAVEFRVYRYM
jgi:hypothetical protein